MKEADDACAPLDTSPPLAGIGAYLLVASEIRNWWKQRFYNEVSILEPNSSVQTPLRQLATESLKEAQLLKAGGRDRDM